MKISYPEALPVSRHRAIIREAMKRHQVVIVCGDTGSGKTTQLPKIALELGRGQDGRQRIGCTQPRRLAATSVARRVADELRVELGIEAGYQIRFEDRTTPGRTAVKFMTDGILLAETQGDPNLRQYDTLIIDEAHERSLNIDFILGYLHRLLPRRPDLKVLISSATLDAESFADFFNGAPVIQVEGRTFPVEDVYQPPLDDRERMAEHIARAAEWLAQLDPLGDTLVFLPGEREIRDAADLLEGRKYPHTLVLPLFARLAGGDQQAVFKPIRSKRRIILATNVAETSLTIPDIRSVIDTGLARVSRYDPFAGIQRLQIEPVSKASARQRRGRCGRVSDGICVRLYDEEDFDARSEYTDPEILRSNLAGVVLQMEHLRLGDPLQFPFIDRPQTKRIAEAYRTLEEIGAYWKKGNQSGLTDIGRTLARLPLDPRVGRILVAADEEGCLQEALIIASALTVQDPRERPQEKQQQADQAHALFRDKRSDFTGWLRWWHAIADTRQQSNNVLRRFCQRNFINYRRVQEWLNLHRELRGVVREMRWNVPNAKTPLCDPVDTYSEPLHRAILAGIPSHIGMHQGKKLGYKGAGNRTFFLFPGSGVFGSAPQWVMAFEMVETAKLYARNAAMFDPEVFEKVAPHLCRHRYTKPHWVPEMGGVYGEEAVLAFGLQVIAQRRVHFGRIDPVVAREIFILEALVNCETRAPLPVLAKNRATMLAAERLEHKLRRLGGLVHPEAVTSFYQERIPLGMCTQKAFEQWASKQPEGTLDLAIDDCIVAQPEKIDIGAYPDELKSPEGESTYPLIYLHNPPGEADGITLKLPLSDLAHVPVWFGDWLVPGVLSEKVTTLVRLLRKDMRTLLPPIREVVERFLQRWAGFVKDRAVVDALLEHLHSQHGLQISISAFDLDRLPQYLSMRYEVIGDDGKNLAAGRDLAALQSRLAENIRARFSVLTHKAPQEKNQLTDWSIGDLPEMESLDKHTVAYPGLCDAGDGSVGLRLWPSKSCARTQHRLGVARLFRIVDAARVAQLAQVLFSGASPKPKPHLNPPPQRAKQKVAKKSDGFGSLTHAFGGAASATGISPAQLATAPAPAPKAGSLSKAPQDAQSGSLPTLSADEILLLGSIGCEPRRNSEDLLTLIITEALGEPRTESDWIAAVANARDGLFGVAGRVCATLARILTIAARISAQLGVVDETYAESISDARDHFDQLLRPGWLLAGGLAERVIDFQGLEMRLTRMKGSPPAKDLAKLERYRSEAAILWAEDAGCACKQCLQPQARLAIIERDCDARLKEFAQELRGRV